MPSTEEEAEVEEAEEEQEGEVPMPLWLVRESWILGGSSLIGTGGEGGEGGSSGGSGAAEKRWWSEGEDQRGLLSQSGTRFFAINFVF